MVTYTEKDLDYWRENVLKPKIAESQMLGITAVKSDNMTDFVLAISRVAQDTENYVDLMCIYAENMPLGVKCTKNAKKLRAGALNNLTEALVERCGGKLTYIVMD